MSDLPNPHDPQEVKSIGTIDPAATGKPTKTTQTAAQQLNKPSQIPNEEPKTMATDPKPAQTTPQPGPDNLPPADSVIAKQAAEIGLFVVEAERDGANLFLVVEGDSVEDVQGFDARRLAYDARFHYGFDNAGIEPHAGSEPIKGNQRYRQAWKLTRGL